MKRGSERQNEFRKGACARVGACLAVVFCLFLFAAAIFSGRAEAGDLQSVSNEALQALDASDYMKALEKGQEALELAKHSGNKQAVGAFLSFLGLVSSDMGKFDEALEYYEEALKIKKEIGDPKSTRSVLAGLGNIYSNLGRYEKALGYFKEAREIDQEIENRQSMAADLGNMGIACSHLGRFDEALGYFKEALAIDKDIGDRKGIAVDLGNIGSVQSSVGQYEEALKNHEEALSIQRELGDRTGIGADLVNIGIIHLNLGHYEKALKYFEDALAIRKEIGDRKGTAAVLTSIGNIYSSLDRYEKALEYHEEALAIHKDTGDRQGIGAASSNIGTVYRELGRYEKALGYFEGSLAIRKEVGDRKGIGADLGNIGVIYSDLGRYKDALSYCEESLAVYRDIGDRKGIGAELGNLGIVYSNLGQYKNALGYYEESLAIDKEIGYPKGVGAALGNMGTIYRNLGSFDRALVHFEQSLAVEKEIGDKRGVADNLANSGAVYINLGQYEKALGYYDDSLAIKKEIGDRKGTADGLTNVGITYLILGRYEKALDYHKEALAIYREIGDRKGLGSALTNIGNVYSSVERYDKALSSHQEALVIAGEIGNRAGIGSILGNIGIAYWFLGQYEKSYASLTESLQICSDIGAPEFVWRALRQLGATGSSMGKDVEAASNYEKALDTIETMRAGLSEDEARISFMSDKISVYDELIGLYQKMHDKDPSKGYDRKALEIFERREGRVFQEEMGKSGAREFAGLPAAVKGAETDFEDQMEKVRADIVRERSRQPAQMDTERLQVLNADLEQIKAAYQDLQKDIGEKYPDYYALKHPEPADLKDIQEQVLGPDEMLLVYGVMKENTCLWVIGKKRFGFYPISIGENQLGQKVNSWRKGTESIIKILTGFESSPRQINESVDAGMKAVSHEGQELYELLIPKDVREALSGAKTLFIVPSGPLYGLPFEALVSWTDKEVPRYLVEDFPIAYLSSASLLKTLRETQARKMNKTRFPLLAFANPVYGKSVTTGVTRAESPIADLRERAYLDFMGGTFLELPETEEEARDIKTVLTAPDSSRPLQLRQDASRSNILKLNEAQKLADYKYVVFSCHGVIPNATNGVKQPALVLSQPDPVGGTGFLTMADTFSLRFDADLVTLSACNTGRGQEVRGEGIIGLTRAFMYAGTPSISVTLWPVESMSEKRLSTGLYENLAAGLGRAEALRQIKLRMIHGEEDESYRYPFFWAPMVLFGDGR